MIRKNPSPQAVLLFLLLGQPALYASSYVMMADSALAAQASVIVVGRILESQTGFSEEPVTRYSVQVQELLKGTLTEDPIRVDVPGGFTSEGMELRIFGAPRFGLEDRILLFLEPPQDGSYGILQLMLGGFQEVGVFDQTLAVRNLGEAREVIAGLSGSVTRNQSKPPRNFQAFTRWLRDYSSGITRDEDYYIEPDPDIQLMIDRFTLTKSTDDFVRWSSFDTNSPRVGWRNHGVGQPGLLNAGRAEFEAALDAWTDDPDTNVQYVYDGDTSVTKGLTGVDEFNTILFEDPNGRIADSYDCEAGGVLALAGIWLSGGTATFKDQEFVTIIGADIAVQDGAECVMGVSANAAAVFTHELGHTLGLDHSCDDDGTPKCDAWGYDQAIMRAAAHLDGRGAALSQDDRAAISFLYGASLDGPGVNQLPVAGVGLDLKVSVGSVVTLQGSGSDPDGDSLTFGWEQTSGPAVSLEEANTANSSFTALDVQQETVLTFRFTVEDGRGGADVDDLTVTIQPFGIFLPVSLDTDHPLFQNTFMGAAIVNLLGQPNQVLLTGLDVDGNEKSSRELDNHLPPLGQRAILTSDFFSEELGATKINAQGLHGPIQGFFMSGDNALMKLDGIGGELEGALQLFFPLARHTGDTETTLIFLFNPNATVNAEVELSLYTQQGTLSAEESTTLAPLGSLVGTLDEIFGEALQISEGFIELNSSVKIKGFQFYARESDFSSLTAQAGTESLELYLPHLFVDDQGGDTEIRLLNASQAPADVEIEAFDDAFNRFASASLQLPRRELVVRSARELLSLDPAGGTITGYLKVTASEIQAGPFSTIIPTLFGAVSFTGNEGAFRSTLPLMEEAFLETLLLQVTQSEEVGIFTGLALLNPGELTALVTVRAFGEDGVMTAEKNVTLARGTRLVDLLNSSPFFGLEFEQVNGYLDISSDQPILAFALFGDFNSQYLSAIVGQEKAQ